MVSDDTITAVPDKGVALDNARISKDSSSKYPYIFWSGYKQHVRGLLTGSFLGATIGAVLGAALFSLIGLGPIGILVFAGAGLAFGAMQGSNIGGASGSRAGALAERHARMIDPTNSGDPGKIASDKLFYDQGNHHYEYPKDRDDNKLFSWRSGVAGTLIGAAAGAILGKVTAGMAIVAKIAAITALSHAIAPIVAGALVFGLLGASFGIERGFFKTVFNQVTNLVEGKKSPQQEKESGDKALAHQLQRQHDIYDFKTHYDESIFQGSIRGYIKGALGGSFIGAFFGAVAGLLAVGILALAAPAAAAASIGLLVGLFAGGGALYGLATFGGAGYEAGAEATARAIDDEFQVAQAREAKGLPAQEATPQQESQKGFMPKVFDKITHLVSFVSGESKKVYNHVYDPEVPATPSELMVQMPRPQKQDYTVTPEEAAMLGQKLDNADKRNFADIIAQPQTQPNIPPL